MAFGEGRDADAEVTRLAYQGDEFMGVREALGVRGPGAAGIAGRVAAQSEEVAYPRVRVLADDVPQFGDRVSDGSEVGDGPQGGVRCDPLGHVDGAAAGGAAGAVGHRHEGG